MKNTLEKALLDAKPATPKSGHDFENFDDFLFQYCEAGGRKAATTTYLSGREATAKNLNRSWDGVPWMVGIMYRAIVDGYQVFEMLGLSLEQERAFRDAVAVLHNGVARYSEGGSAKPNTATKVLYDQIISNGF